jgi:chemotaxis protein CheZ
LFEKQSIAKVFNKKCNYTMENDNPTTQLELARRLVQQLEQGNEQDVALTLQQLCSSTERELFAEIGKLTRDLHDALKNTHNDSRLAAITRDDIPDAKERLSYVIERTEKATHRTLNAVEEGLPLAEALYTKTSEFFNHWTRFRKREMNVAEFRVFAKELDEFFTTTSKQSDRLRILMSEILMAQDFQDLTGQVISRVIRMVQDVEDNLVELLRLSSERLEPVLAQEQSIQEPAQPSRGPIVPNTKDSLHDVVSGQDDVDDLLSSLGF